MKLYSQGMLGSCCRQTRSLLILFYVLVIFSGFKMLMIFLCIDLVEKRNMLTYVLERSATNCEYIYVCTWFFIVVLACELIDADYQESHFGLSMC